MLNNNEYLNRLYQSDNPLIIYKTDKGFGMRSWRYAAVVNDLKVEQWFEEPGINDNGSDDDPYGQSSPSNVLNNL